MKPVKFLINEEIILFEPQKEIKRNFYKRYIWGGVRRKEPSLVFDDIVPDRTDELTGFGVTTIVDFVTEEQFGMAPIYPCLITWEDLNGKEYHISARIVDSRTEKAS